MTYEESCEQLYRARLEQKDRLQLSRDKFRQSVLDRQNKQAHAGIRNENKSELAIDPAFIMPDTLPDDEAQLKWLIFQNLELISKVPERMKEAKENIKLIKTHQQTKKP